MNRRGFLLGLLAAPVIVRAGSLMPVKAPPVRVAYAWREVSQFITITDSYAPAWVFEHTATLIERAKLMAAVDPYPGSTRLA